MQGPAGKQHLIRISWITPYDTRGAGIEHLERGTAFVPRHRLGGQASRDRIAWVELEAEDRSGSVELIVGHALEDVAHGKQEPLDDEAARVIEGDERAAVGHELAQRVHAFLSEAAGVGAGYWRGSPA